MPSKSAPPTSSKQTFPHAISAMPAIANGQKYMFAAARLQAQAFGVMARYQIEALDFLKHRLELDAKLADDISKSGEVKDAFNVFSNFMETAVSEYTEEAGKVAAIGSKIASETVTEIRDEAEAVAKDIAPKTVA